MESLLQNPYVFVLGILLLTVGVPTIAHYWHQLRRTELDASLKHEMLQRGMSAAEIKMVLEASSGRRGEAPRPDSGPAGDRVDFVRGKV
jgi:hypothetical protein